MHGLEDKYLGQVNFVYLDIDDQRNDEFKKALGYRYQPHIFLLDAEGEILNQWIGPITREDLEAEILDAIQ